MAGKCNINIGACTPACTEELPIPSVAVNKLFDLCPLPIKDAAFHTSKHTNLANTLAGQEAGTGNWEEQEIMIQKLKNVLLHAPWLPTTEGSQNTLTHTHCS